MAGLCAKTTVNVLMNRNYAIWSHIVLIARTNSCQDVVVCVLFTLQTTLNHGWCSMLAHELKYIYCTLYTYTNGCVCTSNTNMASD